VSEVDQLDLYGRASEWTLSRVRGSLAKMNNETPCGDWDVRCLLNHMLDTQRYFTGAARGEDAAPPSPTPPTLFQDDPLAKFEQSRADLLDAFAQPGVIEKTGPALGIAMSDQLLHGWDLAEATGQDSTMPAEFAEMSYNIVHGRFTDDQRQGVFGPEVAVPSDASFQDKLLAYTGRDPS
jgi:uncharacterized protein (TIGR03086 family)